ncbi:MAG: hypothetical protein LT106_18670 [Burkholderiaceae bacterium]|nr:hypothetical protein [Burkholderiaceae bacterium]
MTHLSDTQCPTCAHYREERRYPVPTCARATHPHGGEAQRAAVIAWERCLGRHREVRP